MLEEWKSLTGASPEQIQDEASVGISPSTSLTTRNWFLWVKIMAMLFGAGAVGLSATTRASVSYPARGLRIVYNTFNTTAEQVDYWWSMVEHRSPGKDEPLPNIMFVKPHKVGSSSMSNLVRLVAARNSGIKREYIYALHVDYFFAREELQPLEKGLHIWGDHLVLSELLKVGKPEVLENSFKLTLVRNPLDRCFSAFYYYGNKHGIDFKALSEKEMTHLKMKCKLCGKTKELSTEMGEVGPRGINSSVEETLAYYDLIGTTGRFTESLAVMKMLLGLRYGDMLYFDVKISSENEHHFPHQPLSQEPPEVVSHMKSLTFPKDWDLFHAADKRLSDIIEMLEPDFTVVYNKLVESLTDARLKCDMDRGQREYKIPDGYGCFGEGNCQLSRLNKYATDNDLWDDVKPVTLPSEKLRG